MTFTNLYRVACVKLGNDFNHSVLIGLRYNFLPPAPPPPAPAAVPAQAPARSYLVFFDWDKATLTDRARQIIGEAAANICGKCPRSSMISILTDEIRARTTSK
jgi:hypothetical protein